MTFSIYIITVITYSAFVFLLLLFCFVSQPNRESLPGEGNGNPLQDSCLENPMHRGAWRATIQGVARVGHNLATKPPIEKACT